MKKLFFILIACLMVTLVNAAPNTTGARNNGVSKRDVMLRVYSQQKQRAETVETFLEAVKNGEVETIAMLETAAVDPSYLMTADKFGNNAFHLAKDAATVQAVARSIRNLYKEDYTSKILTLKNQTNHSGVIPAVQAVLDLRPGNFFILLEKSDLEKNILAAKSLDKGGALVVAAKVKQDAVRELVKVAGVYTVVDFARDFQDKKDMDKVVVYFAQNTPYLLK